MTASKMRAKILDLLKARYGITGRLTRMAGENTTYLVEADTGMAYVFKPMDEETTTGMIEVEHLAVETLMNAELGIMLPRIIPTREGDVVATAKTRDGITIRGCLRSFVQGLPWHSDVPASPERLKNLGRTVARMTNIMSAIIHPDTLRTHPWDLAAADQHRAAIGKVEDPARRQILERIFLRFSAIARPKFAKLPRGPIHGNLTDANVLIQGNRVSGILDFGNCLDNPLVNELAIALACHTPDEPDPLDTAALMVGAYHRERPLSRDEIEVLFPLMCTRLAVSLILTSRHRTPAPDRAWKRLAELVRHTPAAAARALAAHTGLMPYANQGMATGVLAERRKTCIAPSICPAYNTPVKMVLGRAQYLYDAAGNPYLDLCNTVSHVGHCHPHVVAEGQKQMARLNISTRYLYDNLIDYAERLTATLPAPLDTCLFVNSGSEANDLALKIARTVTGRPDILAVDKACGDEVANIIEGGNISPAALFTASLFFPGGQITPPAAYFQTAFAHVRKAGGLCICDEAQTGLGRTGSHFWAFEGHGVVPDIVVMGNAMGNGHPMSAVVTTRAIASAFADRMAFFSTFGGNPVSCAIGMAVLDVIENEGLRENARDVGQHMMSGLEFLKERHHIMGDVRGTGLFIGVELVEDRATRAPAANAAAIAVNRLKEEGILLGTCGPFSNVIEIKPPLVITRQDADHFVRTLDVILTEISTERRNHE
ncbi:MAG TPA: hypothetical protein DHV36_12690 [Desulfobacteraceae bacterium]|nr:hypothetical protein [Desulfobacteraceae bacterium]